MKKTSIYLLAMMVLGTVCVAQDVEVPQPTPGPQRSEIAVVPEPKVSNEVVQKAIALFRRDPFGLQCLICCPMSGALGFLAVGGHLNVTPTTIAELFIN